ncbi:hypothetical protein HN011_011366 [Eciton burchellii]|nr:hypothetical protein HN011_011366 [Eciton burchellii]
MEISNDSAISCGGYLIVASRSNQNRYLRLTSNGVGHMSALELPKLGHEYHDVTFRNLLPDAVMHDDTASGMSPQ